MVCAPDGAHSMAMEHNVMQIGKEILLENDQNPTRYLLKTSILHCLVFQAAVQFKENLIALALSAYA